MIETLRKEVLGLVEQLQLDINDELVAKKYLDKLLDASLVNRDITSEVFIGIVGDKYFVYAVDYRNRLLKEGAFISSKYKVKDRDECVNILIREIINHVTWIRFIDEYQDTRLTKQEAGLLNKRKILLIDKLPDKYKDNPINVNSKMQNFLDSDEYKQWLES